jgi:hypothetical protein
MQAERLLMTLGLLLTGAIFTEAGKSSADAISTPILAGDWTLDAERSERPPSDKFMGGPGDESQPWSGPVGGRPGGIGRRGGIGRPGGRGGPIGGGFGGAMPSREEIEAMRAVMRSVLNPLAKMTIVQSDSELTISDEDGYRLVLDLNGRKVKSDNGVERKARWRKDRLEEEIKVAMSKIRRRYSLVATDTGKDLVIDVHVEHQRFGRPSDFKFVYVPATTTPADPTLAEPGDL